MNHGEVPGLLWARNARDAVRFAVGSYVTSVFLKA
jgi:hypothetical protein